MSLSPPLAPPLLQCTRQILSEKLGRGSRTVDLELEAQIEILRDNKRKYEHVVKLAQTLAGQLFQMVQTQRQLGDAFADLSLKSLELHVSPARPLTPTGPPFPMNPPCVAREVVISHPSLVYVNCSLSGAFGCCTALNCTALYVALDKSVCQIKCHVMQWDASLLRLFKGRFLHKAVCVYAGTLWWARAGGNVGGPQPLHSAVQLAWQRRMACTSWPAWANCYL